MSNSPTPSSTAFRVLLVDDHDDLRAMLSLLLERKRGYAVETAASGKQALDIVEEFAPHLVISDITMPGMNGFEMLSEMKARDLAPFKAIALSGSEAERDKSPDSAYDAHLVKPVDFQTLFATIDMLTQSQA
jgi:CheY-like chemotaxis protein